MGVWASASERCIAISPRAGIWSNWLIGARWPPKLPMGDCQLMKSWLLRKPALLSQRDRWPYELTAM
jgi:hypothetical protein